MLCSDKIGLAIKLQKTKPENLHIYENFFPRIVQLI